MSAVPNLNAPRKKFVKKKKKKETGILSPKHKMTVLANAEQLQAFQTSSIENVQVNILFRVRNICEDNADVKESST